MKAYSSGDKIKDFALELGCKVEEVIDFSSNINFITPQINVDFNTLNLRDYPNYESLYEKVSATYNIKSNQIELFNGRSSAIFSLFKYLNKKHCTLYSPTYGEYKKAANLFGYKISHINRLNIIDQDIEKNSFVIFINPSTPDGKFYDIEVLLNHWIKQNATILIDESLLDFTNYPSAIQYIKEYNKLYILKSMTKLYSGAGIRMASLLSTQNNILELKKNEPMWKISQFDCIYIQEALKDNKFKVIAKSLNVKNSILLERILNESNIFKEVIPSNANFILTKLKNMNAITLQNRLKKHKILIRGCSNFDFLDDSYIRFSVKSKEDLIQLRVSLKSIFLKE